MIRSAITFAAPLSATNFPIIAPIQMTIKIDDIMSPIPFCTAAVISEKGMPRASPARIEMIKKEINGLILNMEIKQINAITTTNKVKNNAIRLCNKLCTAKVL